MRENQFLGILALILALGMPLTPELFACIIIEADGKVFDAEIRTETELISALEDPNILKITFKNDIVTSQNLKISRNVILDLNGFNLTSLKANVSVVDVKYGNVILTGHGSIVAYGLKGIAVRVKGATTSDNENYAIVLIDENIKLFAPNHYGLFVAPNFKAAYGVTIDFRGTMVAQDGFCISDRICARGKNVPLIKIANHTKITVDENAGVAIHAAGYGCWEVGASDITGASGIIAQSGNITLHQTKIIATGEFIDSEPEDSGLTLIGSVIQAGRATDDSHEAEVTIDGGEYTSLRSYLFAETLPHDAKPTLQMLVIEGGNFAGKLGTFYNLVPRNAEHAVTVIYGGNFSDNVQDYISSSCHINKDRSQKIYRVIEDKVAEEIDENTRLARAEGQLQALIEESLVYTEDYITGDLGKWKPLATKAIASIKRAVTLGKKALKSHLEYERITSAEQSLRRARENLELVVDAMRTELAESIAAVDNIDAEDYTKYSYDQLSTVARNAEALLRIDETPPEDLYSAILDIEINIDLLDSIEEVPEEEDEDENISTLLEPNSAPEPLAAIQDTTQDLTDLSQPQDIILAGLTELIVSLLLTQGATLLAITPEPEPMPKSTPKPLPESKPILETKANINPEAESEIFPPYSTSLAMRDAASITEPIIESITKPAPLVQNPIPESIAVESEPEPSPILPENDPSYILAHRFEYPAEAALLEAKGNLYSMLEAVQDLTLNDYETDFAEQFGELQVAIVQARTILYKSNTSFIELMSAMDSLTEKITGLKSQPEVPPVDPALAHELEESSAQDQTIEEYRPTEQDQPTITAIEKVDRVDWTTLSEVVSEISKLDPDDFTPDSYARVLTQLGLAKSMLMNPEATQAAIEDLVFDINLALLALEPISHSTTSQVVAAATEIAPSTDHATSMPSIEQEPNVTPNLLMSMLAGAYAGMATYRRSRLIAKQQKHSVA